MKVENNLDTDKVRGLVWRLAFPSMLAQFVTDRNGSYYHDGVLSV